MSDVINNHFDETIYKKDSKGKIRFLRVYNKGEEVIQMSGVVGTTSPVLHSSTAKAKNIGKINETTPEMQAMFEAGAKVSTKMSTGYFTTVGEAERTEVILPMLAKPFEEPTYPCYAQPKLDGMRALGKYFTPMISRKGKAIETMAHIQEELNSLVCVDILDGELYAHGRNFQENMRLIKKDRGDETKEVKFHVYDMVLPNLSFNERYTILSNVVKSLEHIELVPTYKISSKEELKTLHARFISEGYEGTIIRHTDAGYAINKRDAQLLKYKDFIDIACEVVDIVPSDKNPKQGVVHCKNDSGTFGCGMKFSHAEREAMLLNKADYIGKVAEIRFFEYSESGTPRFPVCHGFRLDK